MSNIPLDIGTTTSLPIHLLVESLELTNEYSKVTGYNINIQKSLVLLYTNNEKSEREIKETITFTTATERTKCLGIHLPKGGLSFCRITQNYAIITSIPLGGTRSPVVLLS